MATYSSLPKPQKDVLANFISNLRAWCGEQARSNNHADASNTAYTSFVSSIINSLDAGEIIPNKSGLQGAISLTKEEVITLVSHQQNILTDMSTHTSGFNTDLLRQAWVKATGSSNLIG
ncbi:MAG: hypothetical protein ACW99A_18600 [Candidatus Kariarchaeaceae archaeon]|jgi:hypothetical protein